MAEFFFPIRSCIAYYIVITCFKIILYREQATLLKMTESDNGPQAQQPPQASVPGESDADLSSNMGFMYNLTSAPCFRKSTLFGIGGGGAIGALSLLRNRTRSSRNDFLL